VREEKGLEYREVWDPRSAATGLLVARGMLYATDRLIVHAAPSILSPPSVAVTTAA
jgi:hypothetical protein